MVQYYMSLSRDYPKVHMASALADIWTDDESVEAYFREKYGEEENFNAAFPLKEDHLPMPVSLNEVHETIHYGQIVYNEIGYDAAENICFALGICEPEIKEIQSVSFVTDDGITVRNGQNIRVPEKRRQPLAVRILPSYLSKQAELEMSGNLDFSPLGIRLKEGQEGSVSVLLKEGAVSVTFSR